MTNYESDADEMEIHDLRKEAACLLATRGGIDQVYPRPVERSSTYHPARVAPVNR